MRALVTVAVGLAILAPAARAQTVLRMATPAPEGTAWAREIRTFARNVESETHGQVRLKLYFGSVAGDELQVGERIQRDQLDGAFSGGMLCMRLAPSMRVMRVLGLFQGRNELAYVLGRLKPTIDEEFRKSGFYNLGLVGIGPELVFSRRPIRTIDDLKAMRLWVWGADDTLGPTLGALGFHTVPGSLENAARQYDAGNIDGFVAAPAAALAFQWSAQAKYVLPLKLAVLDACVILANRALDPLPVEYKSVIRNNAAKVLSRLESFSRDQDDALLGGLFARQGLQTVAPTPALRAQFFSEARAVRERLAEQLVPRPLLDRVLSLLADYRAEHRDVENE